jgi:hypothetical protein
LMLAGSLVAAAMPAPARASDPVPGQSDHEWPTRSFAQPAFKPDFAAMTDTIANEPPPPAGAQNKNGHTQTAQATSPPQRPSQSHALTPDAPVAPVPNAAAAQTPKLRLESSWPKSLPEARAEAKTAAGKEPDHKTGDAKPQDQEVYSAEEIATARARCDVLLRGLDVVAVPEDPIRNGACGTPAPVQLVSIGKNPQVALSPPAVVTCEMVAALSTWLKSDLQPLARRHLGSPITRIDTMSSYSCRNAYGRKRGNLSEHGKANALDIRSFITASAAEGEVLAHWGPTTREVQAQVAAAKAAADKAQAERALAASQTGKGGGQPSIASAPNASGLPNVGAIIGNGIASRLPGVKGEGTGLGLTQPNRLGGPAEEQRAKPNTDKGPQLAAAPPSKKTSVTDATPPAGHDRGRSEFLRAAHASACKIFGTVLGPESNAAHKNHFHVDMAERPNNGHFCE